MGKNLLSKRIVIPEEYDRLIKDCMRNHVVLYNYALKLLRNDDYIKTRALQNAVKLYIAQHSVFPIVKSSLLIEIHYLYNKFKRGIKYQKNITNIQYMTFIIHDLQKSSIKINVNKKDTAILQITDFLTPDEYMILNNEVKFINLSYSNKNNGYMLSAFS